ncbi:MAG: purine-nucleoside phosphorylase [Nocardioidaceae bacterium]
MDAAPDPFVAAEEAAGLVRARTGRSSYDAALVLGSGWAPAVSSWGEPAARLVMGEVPHFLQPVAEGHRGELLAFDLEGTGVLVLSGRTHLYEGHGVRPVVHGVRTAAALGCRRVVLTNANGSLRDDWEVGRPIVVSDHINATGVSPVEGAHFVDLTQAWSPRLRARARELDPSLAEGVYAQLRGPHYNTAAEAEWLRRVGADLVGMSTVPEAIAAREAGMELFGLSVVTAIEGSGEATDPDAVVAAAEATAARLGPLLAELLTTP